MAHKKNQRGQFQLTQQQYEELDETYYGICKECGEERETCEPDAVDYDCESCGASAVDGMEELMMNDRIELIAETKQTPLADMLREGH